MSQIWGRNVTLFGSDFDSGVSAGIGVIHTGPKSGGGKVTLFGISLNFQGYDIKFQQGRE